MAGTPATHAIAPTMTAHLHSRVKVALGLSALALLWLTTTWRLGPLFSSRPEYAFGWAAPVLCGLLLWERWRCRPARQAPERGRWGWAMLMLFLAGLSLSKPALEVAPILRPVAWALAGCLAGTTLALTHLAGGRPWVKHFAFPVLLFLAFLPWPTRLEQSVMDVLTHWNVEGAIHTLGLLGIPALARGKVIELEQGLVGMDEACSGIRSLQATLVAALFLGELFRLTPGRRLRLLAAGALIALLTNFARTLALVGLASHRGPALLSEWHDPAGYSLLVINFLALWGVTRWLMHKPSAARPVAAPAAASSDFPASWPALWSVAAVVLLAELALLAWFHRFEKAQPPVTWHIQWPVQAEGFRWLPLSSTIQSMLGYDEGSMAAWQRSDAVRVQAVCLRWKPSGWRPAMARAAQAQGHSPTICLPAVGMVLLREGPPIPVPIHGRPFPFQCYVFDDRGRSVYVFVCLWRDRPQLVNYQVNKRAMVNEVWRAIKQGARPLNTEQRLIMASLHGARSETAARAALAEEMAQWVQ